MLVLLEKKSPQTNSKVGWWFQPIWKKYESTMGIFPKLRINIKKNIVEATTQLCIKFDHPQNGSKFTETPRKPAETTKSSDSAKVGKIFFPQPPSPGKRLKRYAITMAPCGGWKGWQQIEADWLNIYPWNFQRFHHNMGGLGKGQNRSDWNTSLVGGKVVFEKETQCFCFGWGGRLFQYFSWTCVFFWVLLLPFTLGCIPII